MTLRYGNVFGPRQDPKGEAGVVAIFMKLLRDGGTPRIFGDGTQTRDYVYVEDVVAATVTAAEHAGGVLNVGMGVETSVVELYDRIQRVAGVEREPQFAESRPGELQRSVLDASLAKRELGWEPEHSLDEGLAETWAWSSGKATSRLQGLPRPLEAVVRRAARLERQEVSPGRKGRAPLKEHGRGDDTLRASSAPNLDLDVIRPTPGDDRRQRRRSRRARRPRCVAIATRQPLSSHLETAAVAGASRRTALPAPAKGRSTEPRSVMVLNGGGRSRAAHAAADRVSAHGYQLGQVGNADGDTPRTLIMYRPGYEAEGARLGRDLQIRIVRPLDGMRPIQLLGAHLVLIIGR